MAPNFLKSSLENASFNIVFQIMCRCITFLLNAFVVRHVGAKLIGIMNVRLLLMESVILMLTKETFTKACLTNTSEHNWAQVVNLLWLTIPLCSIISFVCGYVWLFFLSADETSQLYYTFGVWSIAISCIIELMSLAVQLVASAFLFVRLKIILESIMIALRTVTFVSIIVFNPENALLAFGIAQLIAAVFYTTSHYVYFYHYIKRLKRHKLKRRLSMSDDGTEEYVESEFPFLSIKEFLPGQLKNHDTYFNKNLSSLTWSFLMQGGLKQILTEGERYIMTFSPLLTLAEQGMYDVVNNLGSLAARFIFRPIEESSYFYFTQMVERSQPLSRQNPAKMYESTNVLRYLFTVVTSIGLIVLVFGQSYSPLLLWLYGGDALSSTLPVLLLRAHCLAVLLLSVNGITECYTHATADSATLNKNNFIMICESIVFLGASYIFVVLFGPVGFILGNCVNMGLRIIHSILFINKRYSVTNEQPLAGLVPKPFFSTCLIVAALVTSCSQAYYFPDKKFLHFFIGVIMFMIVVISWAYENSDLLKLGLNKWLEKRNGDVKRD
ncbi:protein RFT1 homolog [Copidosoma floridanum]|uniref:protein RFT1 homolog n=1 Tax=Copidosoma floridanum TaxID=29053 RepID=UPI0006C97997|nr:protein RFT1 homolog [Copidosoma floridanum]XP_014207845.1 protein RFT1 homolog [Copidosoma floridanum]